MVDKETPRPFSLGRWSQRKLAARRSGAHPAASIHADALTSEDVAAEAGKASAMAPPGANAAAADAIAAAPGGASERGAATAEISDAAAAAGESGAAVSANPSTPDLEGLTFDSDFSAFLHPKVDETLRRQALRKLFSDPHFNTMDGLDIYVGDYTVPDPIAPEMVRELVHARGIFAMRDASAEAQIPRDDAGAGGMPPSVPAHAEQVPSIGRNAGDGPTSAPADQARTTAPRNEDARAAETSGPSAAGEAAPAAAAADDPAAAHASNREQRGPGDAAAESPASTTPPPSVEHAAKS